MLHCKSSGDYNSEKIFKIGQYLTKLCVEHLGFTFFWPTLYMPWLSIVSSVFPGLGMNVPLMGAVCVVSSLEAEPMMLYAEWSKKVITQY